MRARPCRIDASPGLMAAARTSTTTSPSAGDRDVDIGDVQDVAVSVLVETDCSGHRASSPDDGLTADVLDCSGNLLPAKLVHDRRRVWSGSERGHDDLAGIRGPRHKADQPAVGIIRTPWLRHPPVSWRSRSSARGLERFRCGGARRPARRSSRTTRRRAGAGGGDPGLPNEAPHFFIAAWNCARVTPAGSACGPAGPPPDDAPLPEEDASVTPSFLRQAVSDADPAGGPPGPAG